MTIHMFPEGNEERWRMVSIVSYLVVLIGLGLPIWWATTRVYRAPLPLDDMLELRPTPLPPLRVLLQAATPEKTHAMVQEMQSILGTSVSVTPYTAATTLPVGVLLLQEHAGVNKNSITLTMGRVMHFSAGVSAARLARVLQAWPGVTAHTALAAATPPDVPPTVPVPAAAEYDVVLTLLENDGGRIDWDVVEAIEEYLTPYLSTLSPLANFTVKSQTLHYAGLGVGARRAGSAWALAAALLPLAVAPLETRLAARVARRPQINLVLYVPPCDAAPVYLYTRAGVRSEGPVPAFISPRWGGVQILNPECSGPRWTPDTPLVMAAAITQVARLLGVPPAPPGTTAPDQGAPAAWQLDWMVRARTQEYLDSARLTLRSLAQLLSEISNIVIRDEVAESVHGAVEAAAAATSHLQAGRAASALEAAQQAARDAEAAFTDPTLLALLYFPDDQKYAVYIPLFLPIMIPVLMSMRQLIRYVKKPKILETC